MLGFRVRVTVIVRGGRRVTVRGRDRDRGRLVLGLGIGLVVGLEVRV